LITSISLRNFQSHEKLDLEIATITMFVGRGDAGKSAIKRALTYAFQNRGGDGFIRLGKDACRVGITFDDTEFLLWEKKRGKGATYLTSCVSNGETVEYNKTGQTVPPQIVDQFRFRGIEIDKNTVIWPQLQGQHDRPYIIGESGSKVARILGKFTKLDVLVQAQMFARKDAEACRKTAHTAEEQAAAAQQDLNQFPDVAAMKETYDGLCQRSRELDTQTRQLEAAETAVQACREWQHAARRDPSAAAARAAIARDFINAVGHAEVAVGEYRHALSSLADTGVLVDSANDALQELRGAYETACDRAGICEACPWR